MSGGVVDAHTAPGIHDLLGIAHQRPTVSKGDALVRGNIPRAPNL